MADWDADSLKVCVIGTAASGKTALLHRIKTNTFSTDLPQRLEEFTVTTDVDGKKYQVNVADTLAADDRARRLAYMDTNCFLICFAYNSPASLAQVPTWVKDLTITHQCDVPTPYFLVGTCSDLAHTVTDAEVKAMKDKHPDKITELFSVSSKDGTGVAELWAAVSKACVKNHQAPEPAPAPSKTPAANNNPGTANNKTNGGKSGSRGRCEIF